MSFDIYGNRLARGHCEVHPHVRQEYPCDLCRNERQRPTVAPYPKCGICGKFESCADSCGVPVCSEGCAHEAERRSGDVDGLRAALTAERERADRAEHDCNALSLDVQTLTAERDALRDQVARLVGALEWYAQMAKHMGAACLHQDSQRMLHLMKELSVDYGKRARTALEGK